ncbi:HAMP domain-containing histidine kinase [Micrococcales bacterium 31B]|nr:HAMP domain-containing histidine kinase [Micrococcales bacterium 31B]
MRARLLLVFAVLAVLTTATFAIPLAVERAQSRTQELVLSRSADLRRLADLASEGQVGGTVGGTVGGSVAGSLGGTLVSTDTNLAGEMRAYTDLYGEPIIVVAPDLSVVQNTGVDAMSREVQRALTNAIRNQPAPALEPITPGSGDRLLLAQPIGADSQVTGAVLIEASTAAAKADVARLWGLVAGGSLLGLLLFGVIAHALSRWVLRPLKRMNRRIEAMRDSLPFIQGVAGPAEGGSRAAGPPELRAVSHTLDSMSSALKASTAAQRRLIADTAHQLRNPMAALQLRLDLLHGMETAEGREIVEKAQAEGDRLNRILDDLLRLARAESSSLTPHEAAPPEPCDLAELAAERVENWRPVVERTGGSLTLVRADAARARARDLDVQHVLDIVIDNAAKYAPGAAIEVSVLADAAGPVLVVADRGAGVDDEHLARLTERFYRSAPSADRSAEPVAGSGLGLSIAQALAHTMGAALEFSHTKPRGLTVSLRFAGGGEDA